jgi:hypothetical protein
MNPSTYPDTARNVVQISSEDGSHVYATLETNSGAILGGGAASARSRRRRPTLQRS